MTTLHIFRNQPDEQVRELIRATSPGDTTQFVLYDDVVDYVRLIDSLFNHDRVICWW